MDTELKIYKHYLETIDEIIQRFFDQQKPFIFCKEGCSICCESGSYPFSKLEFDYLMAGLEQLPENIKKEILEKIEPIKQEKEKSGEVNFFHACPFLIDKKCSVYEHRGLICRSYGLISYYINENDEQKCKCPCCTSHGLNYANVYDQTEKKISAKMWKETGIEIEPVAHNVDVDFLLNNSYTQKLEIKFGEQKCLIDWFD